MVDASNQQQTSYINEQSVTDLCSLLSNHTEFNAQQLERLITEEHYLGLVELANTYWLIGHLNKRLKERNLWQHLPTEFCRYLHKINGMYLQRAVAIKQEAETVCAIFASVTSKIVLLKGATTLFNGLANPISSRYMTDLDILVSPDKLDLCLSKLQSTGYVLDHSELSIQSTDFHHAAPAIRKNGPCYVELHRRPLVNSLRHILDSEEALESAIPLPLNENLSVYQMHPTQQIIHAVAHSELQDYGYIEEHIDLRQLLHFYLLANHFTATICWKSVQQHFAQTEHLPALYAIVYNANQLLGLPCPIDIPNTTATHQHFTRCLEVFSQAKTTLSKFEHAKALLRGYSTDTIINLYGNSGKYPVLVGRLKHLKRHLKLFLKQDK